MCCEAIRELAAVFERAALLIPDGIGVVKALRFLSGVKIGRVAGADLMQNICAEAPRRGYRIFIYGACRETNDGACRILRERCPGIKIVGNADGFVKEPDMPHLIEAINRSEADILFVALGSPRQEMWISSHAAELKSVKLCMGIGGTLDTITGNVKRAPAAFRRCGAEWLYRLLKQPSRIGRQVNLLRFIRDAVMAKFSGRYLND